MAGPRREDTVVKLRPRRVDDDGAIAAVDDAAFAGGSEATLVRELRAAGVAAIELVALEGSRLVGHILFSSLEVAVDRRPLRALALAPLAVHPDRQRRGIGGELIRAGLAEARTAGWEAVILLGHPDYYPRFGFSAELAAKLAAPF